MPRLLLVSLLALIAWPEGAGAFIAHCQLQVDGKTYLNGPCPINLERGGGFSIGVEDAKPGKYFAYVTIDRSSGAGEGWWNGQEGATRAQAPLGTLIREGRCWINTRAKVCASR